MNHSSNEQVTKMGTIWNRSFILLFLSSIFTSVASYMTIPLISKYALTLGTSLTVADPNGNTLNLWRCPSSRTWDEAEAGYDKD